MIYFDFKEAMVQTLNIFPICSKIKIEVMKNIIHFNTFNYINESAEN